MFSLFYTVLDSVLQKYRDTGPERPRAHGASSLVVVARGDGHGHVGEALGGLVHVHVRAVGDGVEQLVARHLRTRGLGGQGQG